MPDFGDIAINRARLETTLPNGETLWIEYRPGAITPRMLHQSRRWVGRKYEDMDPDEQLETLDSAGRMLEAMVVAWNVDNHGVPVVPSVAGLQDVPYVSQQWLIELINADQRAPKDAAAAAGPVVDSMPPDPAATASASTAASSTPVPSAVPLATLPPSSPNGTASTPLLNGLASPSLPSPMSLSGGLTAP